MRMVLSRLLTRALLVALLALIIMQSLGFIPAASAHDHRPPEVEITADKVRQSGTLLSFCWFGESVRSCVDGDWSFPAPTTVQQRKLILVFAKTQPPRELAIHIWRQLNARSTPAGKGVVVRPYVFPFVHDQNVYWQAEFDLPAEGKEFYLVTSSEWADEERSFSRQDAAWSFHVRLKRARCRRSPSDLGCRAAR